MQTQAAKLSSKGNIAIPKEIKPTRLDDVAGMLLACCGTQENPSLWRRWRKLSAKVRWSGNRKTA